MKLAIVSPYPPDITGIGQYGYYVTRALAQSGQFSHIKVLAGTRGTAHDAVPRNGAHRSREPNNGVYQNGTPQNGTSQDRIDHPAITHPGIEPNGRPLNGRFRPAGTHSDGSGNGNSHHRDALSSEKGPSLTVHYNWHPDQLGNGLSILNGLRRYNPDLLWLNLGMSIFGRSPLANFLGFLSLNYAQLYRLPTVVTLHELVVLADLRTLAAPGGRLAVIGGRLLTHMASRADVVCLTLDHYVNWFSHHRPDLACMHIPIGAYQTPERLQSAGSPELLFFTSLAPYKGLEVLLTAYLSLLARYPALRLTIAGAEHPRFPGYGDALRQKYATLPGVRWLGQVPETQVRDIFAQAQVVVVPYLASTGSSSVLYQSAAWGRPLVASDLFENRSVADESGLELVFFKNREPASLAEAIQSLLDSPDRRQAQIDHNYNAIQRCRPEVTCHAYLRAFNMALEAHRSPKRIEVPAHLPTETI